MYPIKAIILVLCLIFPNIYKDSNSLLPKQNNVVELIPADLMNSGNSNIKILGNPVVVDSKYGKAVYFNGVDDALKLDEMPLSGFEEFTVEMIFSPDTNSPFEQRILHLGEISGDRMLLEIRAVDNNWYFDGFVASGINNKALIDEHMVHPLGQWYHVALVVGRNSLTTFINGKQELSEEYSFSPIKSGHGSIGVRQNEVSWFKGKIYKIRITSAQLKPEDFMSN